MPRSEIEERLARFQVALAEAALDAALVVSTTGLYYLTGTAQDAHLVVPVEGEPALYVRRSLERARMESPLERIEPLVSLRELPRAVAEAGVEGGRLGLELDVIPATRYLDYTSRLPDHALGDCSPALRAVRLPKSSWELDRTRGAGRMLAEVLSRVPDVLQAGQTEIELAAEIERMLRRAGHQGLVRMRSFNGEVPYCSVVAGPSGAVPGGVDAAIVGAGPNAAVGKGASSRPIERGEPVVIDVVAACDGYLADATRTLAVGRIDGQLSAAYEVAHEILRSVALQARPGIRGSELYERATELAEGHAGFMGADENRVSFVGHGLGLEVDEPPFLTRRSEDVVDVGTVFALEPKFVFAERGAVGIENTYVVGESGAECVTAVNEDLIEV